MLSDPHMIQSDNIDLHKLSYTICIVILSAVGADSVRRNSADPSPEVPQGPLLP